MPPFEHELETENVIGTPVNGKPGYFHPGPADDAFNNGAGLGLAELSTHRTTPDRQGHTTLFVKIGGLWKVTTEAELEAGVKA